MEIEFTEDQKMLRTTANDFLAAECPKEKVRELDENELGYSPELWKKIAALGWLGLVMPEAYDGMEASFQDLTIILEQTGKNIFPGPFICTMIEGCLPILDAGSEEQKKEFLPKIASGESIFTMALLEDEGVYDTYGITTKATAKGDSFVINGTKLFVEMAHIANYLLCVTRTKEGTSSEDGITLFIVDAKAPGIHCEAMPTLGMDKLCEVRFENVTVPKKNMLGELNKGWPIVEKIIRRGAIAKSAESVGGMQACLDMTVSYTKERVQYDRPLGAFQALQHRMADMYSAIETSKNLLYRVAWLESEGTPCTREASEAKAYINETSKLVTQEAIQLHGAIGTTNEHDVGLYYRRAKEASLAFGDTDYHRGIVADQLDLL